MKANLLIDSGVYKTLLTEGQWENIRPGGANRRPELNKSMIRLVPYGTINPGATGRIQMSNQSRGGSRNNNHGIHG